MLDNRFRIVRHIASGGFGSVVEGVDMRDGASVAIKLFDAPAPMESRFWREVELMRNVRHPVLVPLLAAGVAPALDGVGAPQPYFVMELIDGPTLRDWARDRWDALPPLDALALLRPVAEALDALHSDGIVHRDVKLDNVLLEGGNPGRPRLIDLGIAFSLAEQSSRLTMREHVIASPHYVAPEAARGESPAITMDGYSLAICAYELMVGARPFSGSGMDVLMQKGSELPPYMSNLGPRCFTVPLERAMRACLDRDPRARPTRATDVIRVLEKALREP